MSEHELWREMSLCILSANTLFETAVSAIKSLDERGLLQELRLRPDRHTYRLVFQTLNSPIFLPLRSDGRFRKYRFPKTKSKQLLAAAEALYGQGGFGGIRAILSSVSSERDARETLRSTIPGIGMKEASHFLRNIGFARTLAIIDVHVRRFIHATLGIGEWPLRVTGMRDYQLLENLIQTIAESNGLNLPLFDLAIWQCYRRG